jgi:hypothetical protein
VAEPGKICLWVGVLAQQGGLMAVDSLVDRLRDFKNSMWRGSGLVSNDRLRAVPLGAKRIAAWLGRAEIRTHRRVSTPSESLPTPKTFGDQEHLVSGARR